ASQSASPVGAKDNSPGLNTPSSFSSLPVGDEQHTDKHHRRAHESAHRQPLVRHVHQAEVIDHQRADDLPAHDGGNEGGGAQFRRQRGTGEHKHGAQRSPHPVPP